MRDFGRGGLSVEKIIAAKIGGSAPPTVAQHRHGGREVRTPRILKPPIVEG